MRAPVLLLLLTSLVGGALTARILGVVMTPAHSHQRPFLTVMRALADRGHDVTVITTEPLKSAPKNFKQIDASFASKDMDIPKIVASFAKASHDETERLLIPIVETLCNRHFEHPEIKELLQLEKKFELVVFETFFQWCYLGFIHKLGSPPVVGFNAAGLLPEISSFMGNPFIPSYMPSTGKAYSSKMSFWERMDNAYSVISDIRLFYNFVLPEHERIMRNNFGNDVPGLVDMVQNISLQIIGNHFTLTYSQPLLPNIVELTGLHISKQRSPLPKDIQSFLDGAEHGVVYFSLGSNLRSSNLPESTRKALLTAFSRLPQRVLWKFETDDLPDKPANLMVAKWIPQQDVLAHPNVRLFFTHGGLLSFSEATYFGVPLLAMPFFGDQGYNVAKMVSAGVAERILITDLTTDALLAAIRRVIETPSYQENMKRLSAVYREHQETSLERAVWWVEYVVRHQGAPHLRSAALDLHWWQLLLLDVVAFVLTVAVVTLFVCYKTVQFLLRAVRSNKSKTD